MATYEKKCKCCAGRSEPINRSDGRRRTSSLTSRQQLTCGYSGIFGRVTVGLRSVSSFRLFYRQELSGSERLRITAIIEKKHKHTNVNVLVRALTDMVA